MRHRDIFRVIDPFIDYLTAVKLRLNHEHPGSIHDLHPSISDLHRYIHDWLKEIEKDLDNNEQFRRRLIKSQEFEQIRNVVQLVTYLLAALSDEVILSSKWEQAKDWRSYLMEEKMFGSVNAGENFFILLDNEAREDDALAELFYICIVLGFRGPKSEQELKDIKDKLYSWAGMEKHLRETDRHLSPKAREAYYGDRYRFPPMLGFLSFVIVLLTSMVFYIVASQLMWNDAAKSIHHLSNSIEKYLL